MTIVLKQLVVGGGVALMSVVSLASLPLAAGSAPPQTTVRSEKNGDAEFVKRVAEGGQKEIEAGKLALRQAASADVRTFADRMVKDHTTSNAELLSLADTPPPAAPDPTRSPLAALAAQTGPAFDRAYLGQSVTDHEVMVALFEQEASSGKDARLKLWAEQKLPALREHLEMARGLLAKVAPSSAP